MSSFVWSGKIPAVQSDLSNAAIEKYRTAKEMEK